MDIKRRLVRSPEAGVGFLILALVSTLMWMPPAGRNAQAHSGTSVHPGTGVRFQAALSQPKIVQGADGTIFLDLRIDAPAPTGSDPRSPSDIVIVLDRSGSMNEGDKWKYAIRSIHALLDRLEAVDQVGMITFDTGAQVVSPLVPAAPSQIASLRRIVDGMHPGASTNLGDGLLKAQTLLNQKHVRGAEESQYRRRRVLLLSDGQANVGIVDPEQLGALARRIADQGAVVSTIGMGLGFNETLMAQLADLGMGSFSFLETLESLGSILTRELEDSRHVFADGSLVSIELPQGVKVIEAAGYPFESQGRRVLIRTGQLLGGTEKQFMATLQVANHELTEYPLGTIELTYRVSGRSYRQSIRPGTLQVACISPAREQEAIASVDRNLFSDAWQNHNLGSLMRKVGEFVRSGKREEAVGLVQAYRKRLDEADAVVPGVKSAAAPELQVLEDRVKEAFEGADQKVKQNRAAKSLLGASQKRQRAVQKKQ